MQSLFPTTEDYAKYLIGNALVCSDNIDILRALPNDCVDLIYLDLPSTPTPTMWQCLAIRVRWMSNCGISGSGPRRPSECSLGSHMGRYTTP